MSTLAYAVLTSKREEAAPCTSTSVSPPGVTGFVDILAALVPTEVLTVHAVVLTFATSIQKTSDGSEIIISDPGTLRWVFVVLLMLSVALYAIGHRKHWDRLDLLRMLIPPLAFVGWTMLQKATAFDAVMPNMGNGDRSALAVIGAVVLAVVAGQLAFQADQKDPSAPLDERPAQPSAEGERAAAHKSHHQHIVTSLNDQRVLMRPARRRR